VLFISCNDNNGIYEINFNYQKVEIPELIKIRNITFYNDSYGLLCAGEKNSSGSIYVTGDGGVNWDRLFYSDRNCVNDICIVNDTLVLACGDSYMFLKSTNKGMSWISEEVSGISSFFNISYNGIFAIDEKNFFLVGGDFYNQGLISEFENTQWINTLFPGTINSVCFLTRFIGFFGGSDIFLYTDDGANTFSINNEFGFNIVDLGKDRYDNLYVVYSNGLVSSTFDLGNNWINNIVDHSSVFTDSYFGQNMSVVCGRNGIVYVKQDGGDWKWVGNLPAENFECAFVNKNNEIFLGTDKGEIFILNRKMRP
jgi:photosystem II stability/assembly factor-like uncharacterized protein